MARSFSHNHTLRTQREEGIGRRPDQEWIGIDFRSRDVLDQVWLEQDGFAAQVQPEQAQTIRDLFLQGSRVGVRLKDRHPRPRPAAVTYATGCSQSLDAKDSRAG